MPLKGSGFHHLDADWTQGRAQAISDAESYARRQTGLARKVILTAAEKETE